MFGSILDFATDVVGEVAEVATLGLIESNEAKKLAKAGLTVAEIAIELDLSTILVEKALKEL